jgi:hypothetical protein
MNNLKTYNSYLNEGRLMAQKEYDEVLIKIMNNMKKFVNVAKIEVTKTSTARYDKINYYYEYNKSDYKERAHMDVDPLGEDDWDDDNVKNRTLNLRAKYEEDVGFFHKIKEYDFWINNEKLQISTYLIKDFINLLKKAKSDSIKKKFLEDV